MPDWQILINLGVPMVILGAIGIALWKLAVYVVHRMLDEGGLVGRWVEGEQKWRTALTERIEGQQELCTEHATCIKALTDSVRADQELATAANAHLARLVELHEATGDMGKAALTLEQTNRHVSQIKNAICQACEMCKEVSQKEFPDSAAKVGEHCKEIERIIGEA